MTRTVVVLTLVLVAAGPGCARTTPPVLAPTAPTYPDFLQPTTPATLPPGLGADLQAAWNQLQAGDPAAADRTYARVLKQAPGTAAALAGQGYVALAREDRERAVARFDAALTRDQGLAAAHVGRGQALLQLERPAEALASFEAAHAADPRLDLAPRIEALRFRVVDDTISRARALTAEGRLDEARAAYERAVAASPQSAVLYRELAVVEQRAGRDVEALAHLEKAIALDPDDRGSHLSLAAIREQAGDIDGALASYQAAQRIEMTSEVEGKLAALRERAELARLPAEFQSLATRPTASRADLAAALSLRLPGLLGRAPTRPTPVITDLRGHWARPWVLAAVRAGVMDAYANHTFQPGAIVSRADLAQAVARAVNLLATLGDRRAASWQQETPTFSDLTPEHPSYAAAAVAVAAGVLERAERNAFEPTRQVTGHELLEAITRLQRLAGPLAVRERL